MTHPRLDRLVEAVQTNCHIADARHAADLSLCVYLLQMRELYRWESRIALGATLAREAVGAWLARREDLWASLEGQSLRPIEVDGACFDPFDAEAINARLAPHGLHYGAGLTGPARPGFFLAALEALQQRDGTEVRICGREHARGLFAPPAALAGGAIVVRRESMARWLWEKFEAWGLRRPDGPMRELVAAYGLEEDFDAGLARMLDEQSETLVLHELGELRADALLAPRWAAMRMDIDDRRCDAYLRALRDNLADALVTLPTLAARGQARAVHFWFASFDGLREELFPGLPRAYAAWAAGNGSGALAAAAQRGAAHFARLADAVLALHARHGAGAAAQVTALLAAPEARCGEGAG